MVGRPEGKRILGHLGEYEREILQLILKTLTGSRGHVTADAEISLKLDRLRPQRSFYRLQ
jgi:hypothetical protein